MSRPLTARMAQALRDGRPHGLFVMLDHPSGVGRFCTGVISREWDGYTWTATGALGSVTPVKQSSEIAVQDIVFSLNGVDASLVAKLADDVHNRAGSAWLACFDENDRVISEPYKIISAELDFQAIKFEADGTVTIEIIAHDGMYVLDRAVEEAWTPENQHLAFPGDTGLDMIPSLVHQDLQWTPT